MTDWTILGTPLIIALIPVLIALGKGLLAPAWAERLKPAYPLVATLLGPLLDYGLTFTMNRQADPRWGVAYGLAAIGLREIIDQWRKQMTKPTLAAVLLLGLLTGCAARTTDTGLLTAGQGLNAVGQQFILAGKIHAAHCAFDKPKTTETNPGAFAGFCRGFYDFAPQFGRAYNPAVETWKAAVAANDTSKAVGAQATILQLSTDLAAIAASVLQNLP